MSGIAYAVVMSADTPIYKSRQEQAVEARFGADITEVLRLLYHERGLSQADIAETLGVQRTTVVEWMKRHSIPTGYNRTQSIEVA